MANNAMNNEALNAGMPHLCWQALFIAKISTK
jgi:hypothetical protein